MKIRECSIIFVELFLTHFVKIGKLSFSILQSRRILSCPVPVNICPTIPNKLLVPTICRTPKSSGVPASAKNAPVPSATGAASDDGEGLCHLAEALDRRKNLRLDQQVSTQLKRLRTKHRIQQGNHLYRNDKNAKYDRK